MDPEPIATSGTEASFGYSPEPDEEDLGGLLTDRMFRSEFLNGWVPSARKS